MRATFVVPFAIAALAFGGAAVKTSNDEVRGSENRVRALQPLIATTAASCAPCHAREVAEWERSAMAFAVKSPLFGTLESIVEEQVGRDARCPNGAGVLRKAGGDVCTDETSGLTVTGSGGEHWCVSCHAPGENSRASMPPWSARGGRRDRAPVSDLVGSAAREGIACAGCHETIGPVAAHAAARANVYEGNPTWRSIATGETFLARPEDRSGRFGIGNSGYLLAPSSFLGASALAVGEPIVHRRPSRETKRYLASSEFCGACHDVRLFGTDALGVQSSGEHFKRLRNAYTEWRAWSEREARNGRRAASCQGCHMSAYPGVCAVGGRGGEGCPSGTNFEARAPIDPTGDGVSHYFTSVDVPLASTFADALADDTTIDARGTPVGLRARRDLLLKHTFRFAIGSTRRAENTLEIPITIENVGAGHRVPAGFSQEREIWVELTVSDARGERVYEVGHVDARDQDLGDKSMTRVNVDDARTDARGVPLGVFGADVIDGPDVPSWSPSPARGGTAFRGRGLINLQNGFLRCVKCIGVIDAEGRCQAGPGQGSTRADRYEDGAYDLDSGACRSNLSGGEELFETYFPIGALDADRGIAKGPDANIDTRSAPPGIPITYTYLIDARGRAAPFHVEATLHFRSFPPYLVRAFAAYEAQKCAAGERPSGPQTREAMMRRLDIVDLAHAEARVP